MLGLRWILVTGNIVLSELLERWKRPKVVSGSFRSERVPILRSGSRLQFSPRQAFAQRTSHKTSAFKRRPAVFDSFSVVGRVSNFANSAVCAISGVPIWLSVCHF